MYFEMWEYVWCEICMWEDILLTVSEFQKKINPGCSLNSCNITTILLGLKVNVVSLSFPSTSIFSLPNPLSFLHNLKYDLNLVKSSTPAFHVGWLHLLAYWTPPSSSFAVQLQVRFQIKALRIRKKQRK